MNVVTDQDAFSIGGLEIDLKELALFEKHLEEKRAKEPSRNRTGDTNEPDDLDEYLEKLKIDESQRKETSIVAQRDERRVSFLSVFFILLSILSLGNLVFRKKMIFL